MTEGGSVIPGRADVEGMAVGFSRQGRRNHRVSKDVKQNADV